MRCASTTVAGSEGQRTVLLSLPTATGVHSYEDPVFRPLPENCSLHIKYRGTALLLLETVIELRCSAQKAHADSVHFSGY